MVRLLSLLILSLTACASAAAGLAVRTLDGGASTLAAELSREERTLVMVWTTYCGVCREQYPLVAAFHEKHHGRGASVLGIALDGYAKAAEVAAYRRRHGHPFPSVLADAETLAAGFERATGEPFTGTPTYLLFDAGGALTGYLSGPVSAAALERALER